MFKSAVLLCVALCVVIEARPRWQSLPAKPGYVPVYIQTGDMPLYEINPELAEAFHELPSGRSVNKHIEASPEEPADQKDVPEIYPEDIVDHRPYEKKALKKPASDIAKPIERR